MFPERSRARARFALPDGADCEFVCGAGVVGVEHRLHVGKAVAGDGGNLLGGAAGLGKPGDGGVANVVEGHAADLGSLAGGRPRRAEAVSRPSPAVAAYEQRRGQAGEGVDLLPQPRGDRDGNVSAGVEDGPLIGVQF